ncbi:MAG TPA: hypothetical protein VHO29_14740 [Marmoricola sp.]|nr:hypothetical protein [Marmoricola sp.]
MSSTTANTFGPYSTPEELAKGKRKAIVSLLVAVGAVLLSVVASRTVSDGRLVAVYLLAGGLHFAAAISASVRWSRTPDFD